MPGPRRLYPWRGTKTAGLAVYHGRFQTANTSAPSVISGVGFTVSAPINGVYTITILDGAWLDLGSDRGVVFITARVQDSTTNSTAGARIGTLNSNGTFTIITSSAAGTDANLNGPTVSFELVVRTTNAR